MKIPVYSLLFCLFFLTNMNAEPYYFKQYQVQDGLSHNTITCCTQDIQGFIWLGTRDGLNRFDGYSFRTFRNESGQDSSIGNNWITSIIAGTKGALWVGTIRGAYKYNIADESFHLLPFTEKMMVGYLMLDMNEDLWLILNGKLIKYNEQLDFVSTYALPDGNIPTSLCITPLGQIWVGSSSGILYELDEEKGLVGAYDLFTHSTQISSRKINCLSSTTIGDLILVGMNTDGVKVFDIASGEYTDCFRFDQNQLDITVEDFLQVNSEEVWVATISGLFIYNLRTGQYTAVKRRLFDPYSLSADMITCLYRDREQGIWLGSYAGGVNYHSPHQIFTKYYTYPGENVLKGDIVHDICTDKYDNVWIATEDAGINKYDPSSNTYTNYQPRADGKGISHINIHGLVPDNDKLWIGSISGKIDVLDIPGGTIVKRYSLSPASSSLQRISVVNMKKLDDEHLLVTTSHGVFIYNPLTDRFELMPQLPATRVQSICKDHEGVIWIGTVNHGLYYYDPAGGKCRRFTDIFDENSTVNDIYEDHQNNLWFATLEGVKKYDRHSRSVIRYTVKNGMPGNMVFRILSDRQNKLWITTTNGLVCLNPATEELTTYTREHGLITNQFNYNSGWKDRHGQLYFGMIRGLISFDPDEIKTVKDKVQVYITRIAALDGTEYMKQNVVSPQSVRLNYGQSTFSISFSALSYLSPSIIQYAFCMEGLNPNWTCLTGSHTAYYTKLPPGEYTFKVKAANISGIWNEEFTALRISVAHPWWSSLIARIVYGSLFAGSCLGGIYLLIRQNKKKISRSIKAFENEKEKELYQAKINFFINIAHEIRTPLTLIKNPLDKIMKNKQLPAEIQGPLSIMDKNANRLLALVNQLLDFRKTEIEGYSLNFVKTDIVALIQDISERFRDMQEENNLTMDIKINTTCRYAFIDEEACTKIISNLLSNAFKYARTSILISLSFLEEDERFLMDVSNDGESIPDDRKEKIFEPFYRGENAEHKPGTGLGLPLAKSLAEMQRGHLSVTASGTFTTFRLNLPVNQPNSIRLTEEERTTTGHQPEAFETDHSRPTILIVEDNAEMKQYLGNEINSLYNVVTTPNGKEALSILQGYSIQLIISDIMMPLMDGFTFLKIIKTNLEYSHIPVILLTAKNTLQSRLEGLELGADAYIEKPFPMDILMAQIANLLTNRENIRRSYSHSPIVHMKTMAYTKADENFLERLNDIIHSHIADIDLDVNKIADMMNLSRPTLYRKINALSNLTPNELIRITRLKKAAELIRDNELKIYEIAEVVGFNSQSYFSRSFVRQFGMSPSQYAKNKNHT
ncbi:MAG: response regulator [Tannerellaceae bacterium]|jgi:signal transduction histidine kinase/ligand-binding sensor domain-containing protein/AraC-like DNA-binding protein|nr:response regulator [Tannerellaceae bacterium]